MNCPKCGAEPEVTGKTGFISWKCHSSSYSVTESFFQHENCIAAERDKLKRLVCELLVGARISMSLLAPGTSVFMKDAIRRGEEAIR